MDSGQRDLATAEFAVDQKKSVDLAEAFRPVAAAPEQDLDGVVGDLPTGPGSERT
jgi:hypothetical protein